MDEPDHNHWRNKPTVHDRRHWKRKPVEEHNQFQSVDGDEVLFWNNRWNGGRRELSYWPSRALEKAEKSLVAKQVDERCVELDSKFGREATQYGKITQIPYHSDMLPCYEYFAEGLQQHHDLQTLKMINYNLPPSPWLGGSILPVLETISNRCVEGNMTTLELSNCSLSADDLTSLVTFLAGNKTLCSLNISRNNIESVDTTQALAKAIKKHPVLHDVSLAYCSLGGGDHDALEKVLVACKECESLEIGHSDFDSEGVAIIAKFLGKKNALASFSLMGAPVDNESKKLLTKGLVKNKNIENLCLRSNGLQLPGILRNTKKITESLSRLTRLDLSFNKLPSQGVKTLATFLEEADTSLTTLVMTNNHLTTKGGNVLIPVLKENTTLQHLDLSCNWLTDAIAPTVIDVLKNNSTLLSFDLRGNRSMRTERQPFDTAGGYWKRLPKRLGGRGEIIKHALFDTTSLQAIANCNHTCAVRMVGFDQGEMWEETIRTINSLDVCEGKKIRYKVILAIQVKENLYDPRSFDDVPLELMPYLLEMVQQEMNWRSDDDMLKLIEETRTSCTWNFETNGLDSTCTRDTSLGRLFEIIAGWPSLPLLFVRGAGELKAKKKAAQTKTKSQSNRRKRRKFGDEEDDDDEAWVPKGAVKKGRWTWNSETNKREYIPPPVY